MPSVGRRRALRPLLARRLHPAAWLLAALFALALPGVHAASTDNSGYVAMQVVDLPAAVRFFRGMLDCAPLDGGIQDAQATLLDCGNGNVVALTRVAGKPTPSSGVLGTDDALATARWLRQHHVRIPAAPHLVRDRSGVERMEVTVTTPWGSALQLASPRHADHADEAGAQLASQ
jgi:hypothetical protein